MTATSEAHETGYPENIIARIDSHPSVRIETENYIIHKDPRISATKLGEYLVTDPSKQKTILKNQKRAPKTIILQHKQTKLALSQSFSSNGFDKSILSGKAARLRQQVDGTDWQKRDNVLSACALEHLVDMVDLLDFKGGTKLQRPSSGWGSISIDGVVISIQPTIVFSFEHRKTTKVGAILAYTTKDDSKSLSKQLDGNCAGDYVGVVLLRLLEQKLSHVGVPLASKCFVLDVFRKTKHVPPAKFKTLLSHIEAACETIRLRWDGLEV